MQARVRLLSLVVLVIMGTGLGVAHGAALEVTSLADDGSPGTLRSILATANSNAEADTITFAAGLAGGSINLDGSLGSLSFNEAGTTINGDINADGKPDIMIDPEYETGAIAINTSADDTTLRGLAIVRSRTYGVDVRADRFTVKACYIGTNLTGRASAPNAGNGINASNVSEINIGGPNPTDRNVISGNMGSGIYLYFVGEATIANLLCGLGSDGSTIIPNYDSGVYAYYGGKIRIGLPGLPIKTVISGNNGYGCYLYRILGLEIFNCRMGTNLTGNQARPNGNYGVYLADCENALIGATTTLGWNLISGNGGTGLYAGNCPGIKIRGNRIGTDATGQAALPNSSYGVSLSNCPRAYVGGTTAGARNIICSNQYSGLYMSLCTNAWVIGNYIGVSRLGDKALPNGDAAISLTNCSWCTIGGGTAAKRNVLTSRYNGVNASGYNSAGNKVLGNYIGWLADGTTQAPCSYGVNISGSPASFIVGSAGQGNLILARQSGIYMDNLRGGCVAQANTIGAPIGTKAVGYSGIYVNDSSPKLLGNTILQQRDYGLNLSGPLTRSIVAGNTIRRGHTAVYINSDAQPNLGNLGNASTEDDGGNTFVGQTNFAITNYTANNIKAEGNSFGSTVASVIDSRIYDKLDDPSYGTVDYSPLQGGVIPTAVRTTGVMSVATIPTKSGGVQIIVTLGTPGEVQAEVLNLAGRTIRILPPAAGKTGVNSLLWNGQSNAGTRAPAGAYLCRVTCRTPEGQQQAMMTRLLLGR